MEIFQALSFSMFKRTREFKEYFKDNKQKVLKYKKPRPAGRDFSEADFTCF